MPKVSVIIPVYNTAKYLRKCLDSVINQTLKDIEIICINDGSSDNSIEILREYKQKDSRIIIIDKENEGAGIARNKGLDIAQGEYLGFVDSDDYVDLNFFEKLYNKAKESNYDIVKGNYVVVLEDGEINKTNEIKKIKKEIKYSKIPYESFCSSWWSAIYKTSMIDKYNIRFSQIRQKEDIPFLYNSICVAECFAVIDAVKYYYFIHKQSTCHRDLSGNELYQKYTDWFECRKDTLNFLNKINILKDKYITMFYYKVFNGCIYNLRNIMSNKNSENFSHWVDRTYEILQECKYDFQREYKDRLIKYIYDKDYPRVYEEINFNSVQLNFIKKIFSIRNSADKKYKLLTILGIKIKIKRNKK